MAYVNDNKMLEAMLESHLHGHVTAELYKMFTDIAEQRVKLKLKYDIQRHRQNMIDACVDKCLKIWPNYSFKRDKPFAYFVTVVDNTITLYFMQNGVKIISIEDQEQMYKDND